MIRRRNFLTNTLGAGMAVSLAPMAVWAQSPKRPSFLVLTFEDISPRLGCYGDPVAQYWSAIALGYYLQKGTAETESVLTARLDLEYGDIRAAAAFALLRLGHEKDAAHATLLDILQREPNLWVRLNALNLLDDLDMETFDVMRSVLERIDKWQIRNPMSDKRYVRELAQDLLELKK